MEQEDNSSEQQKLEKQLQENLFVVKNKKDNANLPWVEKYRPQSLDQLISHESILETIKRFINDDKRLPNLLFYGPPGTGKTSTIVALARQLYGSSYQQMVLELNASDDRGIGTVRDVLKTFISSQSLQFTKQQQQPKLVILDEADQMTNQAQFALRRLIEKYSATSRFCIICNYVSKIIPALQSRCTRFKFKHIELEAAKNRIFEICQKEGLKYTNEGIEAAFKLCEGDMRRVVNMLQSLSLSSRQGVNKSIEDEEINEEYVYKFTGNISPQDIDLIRNILLMENIQNSFESKLITDTIDSFEIFLLKLLEILNFYQIFKEIQEIQISKGISLQTIIKELHIDIMGLQIDQVMKNKIIQRMGEIEYRLSINSDEKIQLLSLIGIFTEIKFLKE